jgi:surfactin synthase thioesterase subunit
MIKRIKSYDNQIGLVLYPHAGGYAEQLYVQDINANVYGIVYPDCSVDFNTMCLHLSESLYSKKISQWYAIGSSMGGYTAFLVAHYFENYFNMAFKALHIFGVGDPKELLVKLRNTNNYTAVTKNDLITLRTLDIKCKKISSNITLHIGNEEFFDDNKTINFWKSTTTSTINFIHTEDQHLPSRNSLISALEKILSMTQS